MLSSLKLLHVFMLYNVIFYLFIQEHLQQPISKIAESISTPLTSACSSRQSSISVFDEKLENEAEQQKVEIVSLL